MIDLDEMAAFADEHYPRDARQDINALIAEVKRLREYKECVQLQAAKWKSGTGQKAYHDAACSLEWIEERYGHDGTLFA